MAAGAAPEDFMRRAFELARAALGRVEPNPVVGAVVVQDGRIVGEGRHESYGSPHAEPNALRAAGDLARDADVYVSLEPCSTTGKTPPCTAALIAAAPRRVFYSAADPNPKHAHRARSLLEAAGIEVVAGLLAEEGEELVADFRRQLVLDRPVVVAKWAQSLDGRIATREGESKWITGLEARQFAHEERARSEGILVGIGTVLADDPLLDARLVAGRAPLVFVLDSRLRTPLDSRLLRERRPVLCAAAGRFAGGARDALEAAGAEVMVVPADAEGRPDLVEVLRGLKQRGVQRLMVEGGGRVLGSFFAADLVDLVQVFTAPLVLGDPEARPALAGPPLAHLAEARRLEFLEHRFLGGDRFDSLRVLR